MDLYFAIYVYSRFILYTQVINICIRVNRSSWQQRGQR